MVRMWIFLICSLVLMILSLSQISFLQIVCYSLFNLLATFWIQGVLYGSVGFGCGLIGQGIANSIMNAKRYVFKCSIIFSSLFLSLSTLMKCFRVLSGA